MRKRLLFGGIAAIALFAAMSGVLLLQTSDLNRIHSGIAARHAGITHMAVEDFLALSSRDVVLFDVREADEFAVSHLPAALRVDPDISEADFAERFAHSLDGKRAIFYCSVGVRSSELAARVAELVERETGAEPVNLIGGLFQWHNDGRELVMANGQKTRTIHPYDAFWGRLLDDQEMITTLPTEQP